MQRFIVIFLGFIMITLFPLTVNAESLKGQIQQDQFANYIEITKNQIPLHSRLAKVYVGYQYNIVSKYPAELDLVVGTVQNGVNGQMAYLTVEKSSAAVIGSALGGGLVLSIVTFGITFLVALIATPFIYFYNNHNNSKSRNEGLSYSNQVPTGPINNGDSITFTTLIPLSQQPVLKLTFRDIKSGTLYTISR